MALQLNDGGDRLRAEAARAGVVAVSEAVSDTYLSPALVYIQAASGDRQLRVLDMSVYANPIAEATCMNAGSEYWTPSMVRQISDEQVTSAVREPYAESDHYARSRDGDFDVTYNLALSAADAVNQSATPDNIADQLQTTRSGGIAIFSQLDWGSAAAEQGSPAFAAFQKAKDYILMFSERGEDLGEAVHAVAAFQPGQYEIQESRLEVPEGDYRELFLAAAEDALARLMQERNARLFDAGILKRCIETIQNTDGLVIRPPQIVTVVAAVDRSAVNAPLRSTQNH